MSARIHGYGVEDRPYKSAVITSLAAARPFCAHRVTTMTAGPVSHGNTQVLDPWRRVGGAQKVPASTSFHVTMDSFSHKFQLVQVG